MPTRWSQDEEEFIIKYYGTMSVKDMAGELNRSESSVRNRAYELRKRGFEVNSIKPYKLPEWSTAEDLFLMDNHEFLTLKELSAELNRSVLYIQDRLRELNIKKGSPKKSPVIIPCTNPDCLSIAKPNSKTCSYECTIKLRNQKYPNKAQLEKLYSSGKSLTEIADRYKLSYGTTLRLFERYMIERRNLSEAQHINWSGSKGNKARNKAQKTKTANGTLITPRSGYSKSGKRKDLGVYVRSTWEANVLRWLSFEGIEWDFEPETFFFENIKRGTRTYTPDVRFYPKDSCPLWLEVKGYLRPQDRTKIKRFKKYYPDEFKDMVAITKNDRVEATEFFRDMGVPIYAFYQDLQTKYSDKIPYWET